MKIVKTKFKDLFLYKKNTFKDNRGYFRELFIEKMIKRKFPFDIMSFSKKNVIRGLHLQTKFSQGKYVSILKGSILDIAVDLRKDSKTFGKHFKIILSDDNAKSLFIPAGFAHGFLGLKSENIIHYLCTNYRSAQHEIGLLWNDKDLKIKWPTKRPIISKKDKKNLKFTEFKNLF